MSHRMITLLIVVSVATTTLASAATTYAATAAPSQPPAATLSSTYEPPDECSGWFEGEGARWEFWCSWENDGYFWQGFFYWDENSQASNLYMYYGGSWTDGWFYGPCYVPGACEA